MQTLLNLVKTVAAMSVVAMLLDFLAPEGNLKQDVRMVIGLVFLISVIEPILGIFLKG